MNHNVKIGANCSVHVCVNIGASAYEGSKAPLNGDNCYTAPSAKSYGDIILGSNVAIGENAVVNKSFPSDVTLTGLPAKVIAEKEPLDFKRELSLGAVIDEN